MALASLAKFASTGRKIVAVGRNYAAHAKELNNAVPESPVLFLKPTSSYLMRGGSIQIPAEVKELHHEVELGVVMGKTARDVSQESALDYVAGYTVALDMTARGLQEAAKKKGLPWTVSKGFDTFTPVGDFVPKEKVLNPQNLELWLKVDGKERQRGNTATMLFTVPYLIAYISRIMTLEPGDLILTGTPSGVGPVQAGQVITAGITGITDITFPLINRPVAAKL